MDNISLPLQGTATPASATAIATATATATAAAPAAAADDGHGTNLTGDGLGLEELGRLLRGVPYGLLCLSTEGLTESSPERQDIVSTGTGERAQDIVSTGTGRGCSVSGR